MRTIKRKDKEEGVSAVIGTVMALMVFMFLFGMIQNQYVPVAMKDTEANHMSRIESQFGQLKYGIDSLIVHGATNYSMYTPMTLGSEGMPVFASQTPGYIGLQPNDEYFNVSFVMNENDGSGGIRTTHMYSNTSGMLRLYVPNRYYVPQMYAYSCGALILYQDSGSVMKAGPSISIDNRSGDIVMSMYTVRIIGKEAIKGGTYTEGVYSSLLYTYDSEEGSDSNFINSSMTISLATVFPDAWEDWINTTARDGGLTYGHDYTVVRTLHDDSVYPPVYSVVITINDIKSLELHRSLVDIQLGSQQ